MTGESDSAVLRRKLRPVTMAETAEAVAAAGPVTPSRAMRTSFARAASDSIGLVLNVLGVADETLALDDLLARLDNGMGLISLNGPDGPLGFAAVDIETRSAVVECQTTGRLTAAKAAPGRAMTRTDAALCTPVLARFLLELHQTCAGTTLEGWSDGISVGPHWENARLAALLLEPESYRMIRMTLDFGIAERQGDILLALPLRAKARPAEPETPLRDDWSDRLNDAVLSAPAVIEAVLHRMRLPLRTIENFSVGQVLQLPGVTVSSVRIVGPGGAPVARARLGQVGGMRAIRIEAEQEPQLQETTLRPAKDAALPPMPAKGLPLPQDADALFAAVNADPMPQPLGAEI